MNFIPQKPNFSNPSTKQPSKVSYTKGCLEMNNTNHWLEGKGKSFQSGKYSHQQIKEAYEKYLNESSNGSFSSKDYIPSVKAWNL